MREALAAAIEGDHHWLRGRSKASRLPLAGREACPCFSSFRAWCIIQTSVPAAAW
jgi:hypothetical protein